MNLPNISRSAVWLILLASAAFGQSPVAFEVASIRPHVFAADPGAESSDTNVSPGGRFTGHNVTARKLLRMAFLFEDSRITGTPAWIDSQSYDIEAKTEGGTEITPDNIFQLMLSLLESRFNLMYHRDTRETAEYALEVAKGGLRLTPDTGDSKPSMSTNSIAGAVTLKNVKVSMQDFAGTLTRQVGRPVIDQTGSPGLFDFDLTWAPDLAPDAAGPSIFTALQALGLRLVSTKGMVEIVVIDHLDKASANSDQ